MDPDLVQKMDAQVEALRAASQRALARRGWNIAWAMTVDDYIECARGNGESCAWAAIGFIPWGELGKLAKFGKATEEGLKGAHQAAGSFDKPGGMSGTAVLDDDSTFNLSSGGDGRNLRRDHVAPPGTTAENFHHLENQTAAIMRGTGSRNAVLFITGTYGACKYCASALRSMLPEGGRLLVIWRDESGAIRNRLFIGGPDN